MPWNGLNGLIPYLREFTAVNLEFMAVNSPMFMYIYFMAQGTITCDSR